MSAEMNSVKIASGEESVKTTATELTAQTGKNNAERPWTGNQKLLQNHIRDRYPNNL